MPGRRFWGLVLVLFAIGFVVLTYERVRGVGWYTLPERDAEAESAAARAAEANRRRLAAMQSPWPRDNWSYCRPWEVEELRPGHVGWLRDVEQAYRDPAQRADGMARLVLYDAMLSARSLVIQPWRENIARSDPPFARFIDEGIDFVERFCALPDGEAMRQAAHAYVADDGPSGRLRRSMLMAANLHGSMAAKFEYATFYLSKDSTYAIWTMMENAAANGYLPAQLTMAEAYLSGDRLKRNEFKAAYWYARARLSGAPVDERFETIGRKLPFEQRRWFHFLHKSTSAGFFIHEEEVLSGKRF